MRARFLVTLAALGAAASFALAAPPAQTGGAASAVSGPAQQQAATAPAAATAPVQHTPAPATAEPAPTGMSDPTAAAPAAATQPAATSPLAAPASPNARVVQAPAPAVIAPAPIGAPAAGSLMQTIFALVVVLAALAALAWFLKRFGPRQPTGQSNLHIVGALNLGGRERIVVVEVGDQWIVVGASPGRINSLATMPRQEGLAASAADAQLTPHATPATNFSDWLKQTIDKRHAK